MEVLACGHVAHPGARRLCPHLLGPDGAGDEHMRLLTGHGIDYDLCCLACDKTLQEGQPAELVEACEGCVSDAGEDFCHVGWRGKPGIGERAEPLDTSVSPTPLPAGLGAVSDLAPVTDGSRAVWLVLAADGWIGRLDAGSGRWEPLARAAVPAEPADRSWHLPARRLHASPGGEFAAVVNDYGRYGEVIDLRTGTVTLTLDGGDYHPEQTPFSLAFTGYHGGIAVVHRTGWNRLDASDARTGQPLTARTLPSFGRSEPPPDHYLDYFHGALHVSPGGRWLADDGWVWSPVGAPVVWDARAWLHGSPWESEDGLSWRPLCHRQYHWNSPMCWVADDLLAVSGIGGDDEAMLDGVRVFDASTGEETLAFAGPRGALFADDRRLYAAAPGQLEVWDPFTGERTGILPGFTPTHHHPGAAELAAAEGATLRRWSTSRPGQRSR